MSFSFKNFFWSLLKGDYWKENDSYKNTRGEGFLERYLRNLDYELDDEIYPFIARILDLFNSLAGDSKYLKYMSYNAGDLPLTGTTAIDKRLVAWAVTLYKAKGTIPSYEIIFSLFGLGITVMEVFPNFGTFYDAEGVKYDGDYHYDQVCPPCITYHIGYYTLSDACGDTPSIVDEDILTLIRSLICLVQPIDARLGDLIPVLKICDEFDITLVDSTPTLGDEIDDPLVLWTSPISDASSAQYAITQGVLSNGTDTLTIPCCAFYSASDDTDMVTYLNTLCASVGMTGAFAQIGNDIVYNQAVGETWYLTTPVTVLPKMFTLKLEDPASGTVPNTWAFGFRGSAAGAIFIDMEAYPSSVPHYGSQVNISASVGYSFSNAYSVSNITRYPKVFHNNIAISALELTDSSAYVVKDITGDLPASIGVSPLDGYISILNQKLDNPATFALALSTASSIKTLLALNNDLVACTPNLFLVPFPNLTFINFQNNKLSSAEVDLLFNDFVANTPAFLGGGSFLTRNQVPAAPPTVASLTARNALIAAGWTVTTD